MVMFVVFSRRRRLLVQPASRHHVGSRRQRGCWLPVGLHFLQARLYLGVPNLKQPCLALSRLHRNETTKGGRKCCLSILPSTCLRFQPRERQKRGRGWQQHSSFNTTPGTQHDTTRHGGHCGGKTFRRLWWRGTTLQRMRPKHVRHSSMSQLCEVSSGSVATLDYLDTTDPSS